MSVITSIRIKREIFEKAKKLGLNVSKICENALKVYIERLEGVENELIKSSSSNPENSQEKGRERETVGVSWWTGRDLNPRPPPCEGGVHAKLNYRPILISVCIVHFG